MMRASRFLDVRIDGGPIQEVEIVSGIPLERRRVTHPAGGESRTKQADIERTNINKIMRRYANTGTVPANMREPWYGDFSNVDDYLTARLRVQEAQDAFEALPADLRKHVDNDPAEFMRLAEDPERREEAIALGLYEAPEPEPEPQPEPEPVPDPAPEPSE